MQNMEPYSSQYLILRNENYVESAICNGRALMNSSLTQVACVNICKPYELTAERTIND